MKLAKLSGSDYFHLLVDRKMLRNGLVGNISRFHLELNAEADLNLISQQLSENKTLANLSKLKVQHRWPALPLWKEANSTRPYVQVQNKLSWLEFESAILNRKVDNENGLVFIDLCALIDDSKHVVISMHHVLFDHQGMMNFLKALSRPETTFRLFPSERPSWLIRKLSNACYMTVYMLSRGSGKLGTLVGKNVKPKSYPRFKTIRFSKEETASIEANAWKAGSRIGQSAFYLSATAKVVFETICNRGQEPPHLWFSVPHNNRRKGASGHLVSNQLSFLFFRLQKDELKTIVSSISSINRQLKQQLKTRIIDRYSDLQDVLRWMPMMIYERMVDLASNGKMSSFGYSDLGEQKVVMDMFLGAKLLRMLHYPPVPSPPGFNVIATKQNGELAFVWAYFDESLSQRELEEMELSFRQIVKDNPTP